MTPSTYRLIDGVFRRFVKGASVRVERFADRALDQLQTNLVAAIRELQVSPIAGGNRFADVVFTSGVDLQIPHLLDRAYEGFIITRTNAAVRFTEIAQTPSSLNDRFITLRADANCTADVYVF